MEDDVAPNALVEEGSHHVEEDVEDPEDGHDKSSYFVALQHCSIAYNHHVPWMVDNVDATEPEWEATSEESSNAP